MPYQISQTSFARTLYGLFDDPWIRHLNSQDTARLIENFWAALRTLCPESTADPAKHLLMKTAGVSAIHQILPDIVAVLVSRGIKIREIQPQHFVGILKEVPEMSDGFWSRENQDGAKRFLGEAGARQLATLIRKQIPKPTE